MISSLRKKITQMSWGFVFFYALIFEILFMILYAIRILGPTPPIINLGANFCKDNKKKCEEKLNDSNFVTTLIKTRENCMFSNKDKKKKNQSV